MRSIVPPLLFVAALIALGWGGLSLAHSRADERSDTFHYRLHHELKLDARQEEALGAMELRYEADKARIEVKLKESNARLGTFIKRDKAMSPRVQQTLAEIHVAMGDLQKLTLDHLFEMSQVLGPEQEDRFYGLVADAFARSP